MRPKSGCLIVFAGKGCSVSRFQFGWLEGGEVYMYIHGYLRVTDVSTAILAKLCEELFPGIVEVNAIEIKENYMFIDNTSIIFGEVNIHEHQFMCLLRRICEVITGQYNGKVVGFFACLSQSPHKIIVLGCDKNEISVEKRKLDISSYKKRLMTCPELQRAIVWPYDIVPWFVKDNEEGGDEA